MCNIGSGLAGEVAVTGQPTEGVKKENIVKYFPVVHPSAVLCRDGQGGGENQAADVLAVIELCRLVDGPPYNCEYLPLALQTVGISITNMIMFCEEEIRRRTAEALLSITQIAPLGMDLLDLVGKITDAALHMINAEDVCIFFVDDYSKEIWLAKNSFTGKSCVRIPIGKSISGLAALTGHIMNIPDCRLDPQFDAIVEQHQGEKITSMLCVPIPPPHDSDSFDTNQGKETSFRSGANSFYGSLSKLLVNSPYSKHKSSGDDISLREVTDVNSLDSALGSSGSHKLLTRSSYSLGINASNSVRHHTSLTAVLKAVNKRGGESFDDADEHALTLFCEEVNNILVPRAVEANLMRRAVSEKSNHSSISLGSILREEGIHTIETSFLREYGSVGATMRTKALDLQCVAQDPKVSQHSKKSGVMGNNMARRPSLCSDGGVGGACKRIQSLSLSPMVSRLDTPSFSGEVVDLHNWDFDPFKEDMIRKCSMIEKMFQYFGFEEHLGVGLSVLRLWVHRVREAYQPNPFHNFNHAFSVAHVTWMILYEIGTSAAFSSLEMIACLLASYCHDVDHPGHSNVFEVQSESDLALMYSDDAVLERHHIHVTFRILRDKGGSANVLKGLDRQCYQNVREIVIKGILATDMSQHVSHCSRLRKLVSKHSSSANPMWTSDSGPKGSGRNRYNSISTSLRGSLHKPPKSVKHFSGTATGPSRIIVPTPLRNSLTISDSTHSEDGSRYHQHHMLLLETVIHCADISGQVLTINLALDWGRRVLQEFKNQAVLEESRGLPLTFSQESNEIEAMKGQLFFLTNIVQPLWEPFVDLFPGLSHRITQMKKNAEYYKSAIHVATLEG